MSIRLKDMKLMQIFISNLKKRRKELGISQMTLSLLCDTTTNYIGQIEMGRRNPSFEKIEEIASALGISSYELFLYDNESKKDENKLKEKPRTKDYLLKLPVDVKKEIISHLLSEIKKNINASFDLKNY